MSVQEKQARIDRRIRRGRQPDAFEVERCPLDYSYQPPFQAFVPGRDVLDRAHIAGALQDALAPFGARLRDMQGRRWLVMPHDDFGRVLVEVEELPGRPGEYVPCRPLHFYHHNHSGMHLREMTVPGYLETEDDDD